MNNLQRYTDDQVRQVVDLFNLGYGARSISTLTPISEEHVTAILQGESRVSVTGGRLVNGHREINRSDAAKRGWEKWRRENGQSNND